MYDLVKFTNGYSPTSPTKTFECKGISIGEGKTKWGAEKGKKYFVIKLGDAISNNVPPQPHQ